MKVPKMLLKVVLRSQVVLLFLAVVLYGQNAFALAISQGQAYYDWNNFSITGSDGLTTSINSTGSGVYDKFSEYKAGYSTPNNYSDISPWFTTTKWGDASRRRNNPAGTAAGYSYSQGTKTNADLYVQSDMELRGDPGSADQEYGGLANINRGGYFTVGGTGSGTLTFTIDYHIFQELYVDNLANDYAKINTDLLFYAYNYGTELDNQDTFNNNYELTGVDGAVITDTRVFDDSLTFSLFANAGDIIYFTANLFNEGAARADNGFEAPIPPEPPIPPDPVPEPATVFLLGSGILGYIAKRRMAVS